MIISVQLIDISILMSGHFHHTPKIGVLLIAAQHLHLPVARDDNQWRSVRTYVKQRGELVDTRLGIFYPLRLPISEMADRMTAERD